MNFNDLCRHSRHDGISRNVFDDDRVRTHNSIVANGDFSYNLTAYGQLNIVAYHGTVFLRTLITDYNSSRNCAIITHRETINLHPSMKMWNIKPFANSIRMNVNLIFVRQSLPPEAIVKPHQVFYPPPDLTFIKYSYFLNVRKYFLT